MRKSKVVQFTAKIQEMADQVVLTHIGSDRLDSIRSSDSHPMFIGLKVAEEGLSRGEVMGHGNQDKIWPPFAVAQLGWAMNEGDIGLFSAHEDRGESREQIGQVLSGWAQGDYEEDGRLQEAFAIAYVSPGDARESILSKETDTASAEAEVVFIQDSQGNWIVDTVQAVTGVALGNASINAPGFPGAGIVAVIQELEKDERKDDMDLAEMIKNSTPDQIRAALAGTGSQPSQIFTQAQLQADTGVQLITQKVQGELDTAKQELTDAKTVMVDLKKDAATGKAGTIIAAGIAKIAGLTDEEKTHVQGKVAALDLSGGDDLDKAVGDAIAAEVKAVSDLRQLYGKEAVVDKAPAEDDDRKKTDEEKVAPKVASSEDDPFLAANNATTEGALVES